MGYTLSIAAPVIAGVAQVDPTAGSMTDTSTNSTSGGPVIVDTPINPAQPDPYQPVPQR
jgi:hypothetical protein